MLEIDVTPDEIEMLLRAMALARASGRFPDPAVHGEETRSAVLEQQMRRKLAAHEAGTWAGRMKAQKRGQ
jgi:hypothetical protein